MEYTAAYQKYVKYLSNVEESPSKSLHDDINRLEGQLQELQSKNGERLQEELYRLDSEIQAIDESITACKSSEEELKQYKKEIVWAWIRFVLRVLLCIIIVFGVLFIAIFYIFAKFMDINTRNRNY